MTKLGQAWQDRLNALSEGRRRLEKSRQLSEERFTVPKNAKTHVWMSSMEAYYRSEAEKHEANVSFFHADFFWAKAVLEEKGDIRLLWEEPTPGHYKCTLETGEVFVP